MRLFKSKEKLSESESVYLADIEQKIKAYKAKGYRVPTRKMIKTAAQIKGIRRSAAINTAVLDLVAAHIHEGMTTEEIDTLVYNFTIAHGAIPAPLNYEGFPKSVYLGERRSMPRYSFQRRCIEKWGYYQCRCFYDSGWLFFGRFADVYDR